MNSPSQSQDRPPFSCGVGRFRRPSFAVLCTLMAAESVAANVVHPVEPAFYIALALPDWIFGAAFAAMAFGLFLWAPFWGVVSDRIGRVPTLAVTMFCYGVSQLAFLVSTTVPTILLARFAAGSFCSGCGVAAMAYVADVSDVRSTGRRMTLYAAVTGFATAFGYLVGGLVGRDEPGRSFVLQFFILAVVAVCAGLLLREGPAWHPSAQRLTLKTANPLAAFAETRSILTPWMAVFMVATLLACSASAAYDNSFNYYLRDQVLLSAHLQRLHLRRGGRAGLDRQPDGRAASTALARRGMFAGLGARAGGRCSGQAPCLPRPCHSTWA